MKASHDFLHAVINSVPEHLVVIDHTGAIQFVNRAWVIFGQENGCRIEHDWCGVNYLHVCDESAAMGEEFGRRAADGIRRVIDQSLLSFRLEYPCHSPTEKRWFLVSVTPFEVKGAPHYVISHQNITERKLAEEQVLRQSRIDGLTQMPNRRYFDQFLAAEWHRCTRSQLPISLALMDIDHFKRLNDHGGHLAGDDCLIKIGALLNQFSKRPGDFFARYGGDEFSLVFGNTTTEQALTPIHRIIEAIDALNIPNEKSPIKPTITVSFGLATMVPKLQDEQKELIQLADQRLYAAKEGGRNRVIFT
jgi:diguanylate cyclase (GGDEF)-like protein